MTALLTSIAWVHGHKDAASGNQSDVLAKEHKALATLSDCLQTKAPSTVSCWLSESCSCLAKAYPNTLHRHVCFSLCAALDA